MTCVRVGVISSGSKGNSLYVEGPEGALLVDVGLSAREIMRRITAIGGRPDRVRGILVTHEHIDHVRGMNALARRLKIPIHGTSGTLACLCPPPDVAVRCFETGDRFDCSGFSVLPFALSHDAVDPVGYVMSCGTVNVGMATDLGCGTVLVRERLRGCRAVILESNHDEKMLIDGPYPWFLKQRVKGRRGHLSNVDSNRILKTLLHSNLECVVLAHLSEVNNMPGLALDCASTALAGSRSGVRLVAGSAAEPLAMINLDF